MEAPHTPPLVGQGKHVIDRVSKTYAMRHPQKGGVNNKAWFFDANVST
jgi:hypothetical protein